MSGRERQRGVGSGSAGESQPPGTPDAYPFPTLPDYVAPGLRLVFVGINPSVYSVQRGHYFARSTSRFWPAFSRSRLSASIRAALGQATLGPADDALLLEHGIGFTDVVKRPSRNAAELRSEDFQTWAPRLRLRLERAQPELACFHGVTAFRAFSRFGLGERDDRAGLGLQPPLLGVTRLFVVPNPSPANAHFTLTDQVGWYDQLAALLEP